MRRAPFDLVLCADVLYERASVAQLLSLLPRLGPEAWLADPGRPAAEAFIERAAGLWTIETRVRGVVRIHRLILQQPLSGALRSLGAPQPREDQVYAAPGVGLAGHRVERPSGARRPGTSTSKSSSRISSRLSM